MLRTTTTIPKFCLLALLLLLFCVGSEVAVGCSSRISFVCCMYVLSECDCFVRWEKAYLPVHECSVWCAWIVVIV